VHYYVLRRRVGDLVDIDKLEILSEQLLVIADMWEMEFNNLVKLLYMLYSKVH